MVLRVQALPRSVPDLLLLLVRGPAWSVRSASVVLWAHIQAGPGLFDLMLPMGRRILADLGRSVTRRGARAEMGDPEGRGCT